MSSKKGTGRQAIDYNAAVEEALSERLLAAGKMAAPGLAKVEAAPGDGSWNALDPVEALEVRPETRARRVAETARLAGRSR